MPATEQDIISLSWTTSFTALTREGHAATIPAAGSLVQGRDRDAAVDVAEEDDDRIPRFELELDPVELKAFRFRCFVLGAS